MTALTPLQHYQHKLSAVLEAARDELDARERQALLTYAVQRATIELAPSTAVKAGRVE